MKKVLVTMCLGVVFITSCGSGGDIKADAKKMADLTCKMTRAVQADPSKAGDFTNEMTELSVEMTKKYSSVEDMTSYTKALTEEMKNCK